MTKLVAQNVFEKQPEVALDEDRVRFIYERYRDGAPRSYIELRASKDGIEVYVAAIGVSRLAFCPQGGINVGTLMVLPL